MNNQTKILTMTCRTLLLSFSLLTTMVSAQPGIITTVAGTGVSGFSGDGGAATMAKISRPVSVSVDGSGNIFFVDQDNQRIRKVDAAGIITTVAGTGVAGFNGDNISATTAQLQNPRGVFVDGSGNIFIADGDNQRIRKVDAGGIITTVAGTGVSGFSGDGGPATVAKLNNPYAVSVDGSGNIFIVDGDNQRIRKVDAGGTITTVAGTGVSGFSGDGGPATAAKLDGPYDVSVDGSGNIFIADRTNQRIRKVDAGGSITTVAGTGVSGFSGDGGPATAAKLKFSTGVFVDGSGNIFIADILNQRIRKVDAGGTITTVAGTGVRGFSGDGGAATAAQLANPIAVAVDGSGNIFIADQRNRCIRKVGGQLSTVASTPNLISSTGESGSMEQNLGKGLRVGQTFTMGSKAKTLTSIDVKLALPGNGGILAIDVYEFNAGKLAAPIASTPLKGYPLSEAGALHSYDFSNKLLEANKTYAFILRNNGWNYFQVKGAQSSDSNSDQTAFYSKTGAGNDPYNVDFNAEKFDIWFNVHLKNPVMATSIP